jgi:hypothetical protein
MAVFRERGVFSRRCSHHTILVVIDCVFMAFKCFLNGGGFPLVPILSDASVLDCIFGGIGEEAKGSECLFTLILLRLGGVFLGWIDIDCKVGGFDLAAET